MKLAVIADIHSNFRALEAVAEHLAHWRADLVVVAGDVVNRGAMPQACFDFVTARRQDQGWHILRGNHEDYVIEHLGAKRHLGGIELEIYRMSYWTFCQLGDTVHELAKWPLHFVDKADAIRGEIRITHASMRGNRDSMIAASPDSILMNQVGLPLPRLFCSAHTHLPFVRQLNDTCVVNAGSVGMPFDHDTRACYAQLTWQHGRWNAQIVRVNYDRDAARRDFYTSGYVDTAGGLSPLVLDEFENGCSHLFTWNEVYRAAVMRGEISIDASVKAHLEAYKRR
ncbi:MAG: metallophosphatase family protein [Anaerolineae bacterium]|nr:metallophosphatase family protein [Anaerolineae bacterium]